MYTSNYNKTNEAKPFSCISVSLSRNIITNCLARDSWPEWLVLTRTNGNGPPTRTRIYPFIFLKPTSAIIGYRIITTTTGVIIVKIS